MKLLVVDDSMVMRKIIRTATDMLQMEIVEAQDGAEAMEMLLKFHKEINLILLDWNMPEKSGYDILVEIKENELYKEIPVMMVTTEGQKANIIAAVQAGACNYLVKPFSVEELEVKIRECMGKGGNV
ncbi:MAG: response regulator [Treponema sp.]|nr:response regulator [Treponema sp.]